MMPASATARSPSPTTRISGSSVRGTPSSVVSRSPGSKRPTEEEGHLPGDPQDAHAVGPVGGQLDLEDRVVPRAPDLVDGQPDSVKPFDQRLEGDVDVHVLPQPVKGDAHRYTRPRNRTSFS